MVVFDDDWRKTSYQFGKGAFSVMTDFDKPDKPFYSYSELIELMRSRGIVVDNEDFAKTILSSFSYYTLINGYKSALTRDPDVVDFYGGITFEAIYTLHIVDTDIGNVLLKYILHIENALKSRISYIVSSQYGVLTCPDLDCPEDYLHKSHYSGKQKRNPTLKKLKNVLFNPDYKGYISSSFRHYRKNHNHIPPWILSTTIPFGLAVLWYSILSPNDKEYVCNEFLPNVPLSFDETKEYFTKSIEVLKDFRNSIAHGSRTYLNFGKKEIPKKQALLLGEHIITEEEYNAEKSARLGLHAVTYVIPTLLPTSYLRYSYLYDLTHALAPYSEYDIRILGRTILEILGLPNDILERLEKNISAAEDTTFIEV